MEGFIIAPGREPVRAAKGLEIMRSTEIMKTVKPMRKITDLKDLLQSSVELFADKTAYLEKDKKLGKYVPITYREVGEDIKALGTKLTDMGLQGKRVAVIGETRYEWILTYFATVAGVGEIVPLDKNLPAGELLGLIERSKAQAIVFSGKQEKVIRELMKDPKDIRFFIGMDQAETEEADEEKGTPAVYSFKRLLEDGNKLVEGGDRRYLDREIDPDQMSTLLFTSGTTGLAKGVMMSHRNIAWNVYAMSQYFIIPEPGIVFSMLPIHHVYEMTCDIWTTFYQGKTIAICEGIRYIQKNLQETHANVMLGVPLVFEKLYKGMLKQAKKRGELEKLQNAIALSKRLKLYKNKSLVKRMFKTIHDSFGGGIKYFIEGGAAADPFVIEEFQAMGFPLIQGYGMSEHAPIIALNPMKYNKPGAAGIPLPGEEVRVINQDEDGIGEVIVRSPSVMMGYYENPEATRDSLQNGWLHTGDLGYFDEEGYLFLTGRSKTVIVTKGGKNIFPKEVEDTLKKSDLVKEVLVHGVEDERVGNVIITADILPNYELLKEQKGEMSRSEIYHFYQDLVDEMNETMPPYKQVKRINIRTTEFAMTTTGKIKRYGNRLSPEDMAAAEEGRMDPQEQRLFDEKNAKRFVKEIVKASPAYPHAEGLRPAAVIRGILNESAQKYGKQTAFIQQFLPGDNYVQLTYGQARADVEGLGTAMINRGWEKQKIAILGANTYQIEISILTALTGIGAAVPLDRQLDPEELARQINKSGAKILVCDGDFADLADQVIQAGAAIEARVCCGIEDEQANAESRPLSIPSKLDVPWISWKSLVKEGQDQVSQGDRQYLDAAQTAGDLAAIFFTSGATGTPKAVPLTQGQIASDVVATASLVRYKEDDTVLSVIAPQNIYQNVCGLLLPLYCGAAIANFVGVDHLKSEFEEVQPTVFIGEPVMMKELAENAKSRIADEGQLRAFRVFSGINRVTRHANIDMLRPFSGIVRRMFGGKIRMLISGGAYLDSDVKEFFRRLGIVTIQGYGMTETSSVCAIEPDVEKFQKDGCVGRLIPGVRTKVIDRSAGGVGDILVKGPTVMDGYFEDPENTEKYMANGWFRTGDSGYVDGDGYVYLAGRKKN